MGVLSIVIGIINPHSHHWGGTTLQNYEKSRSSPSTIRAFRSASDGFFGAGWLGSDLRGSSTLKMSQCHPEILQFFWAWLVGTGEIHEFVACSPYRKGMSSSQLTKSCFSEGFSPTNKPVSLSTLKSDEMSINGGPAPCLGRGPIPGGEGQNWVLVDPAINRCSQREICPSAWTYSMCDLID